MLKNRDAFNSCILTIKVHQVGAQAHFFDDFGKHFALPWGILWSAIGKLFSGLVPGRVPGWILGAFWSALGSHFETILVIFWEHSGTYVGECYGMLWNAMRGYGILFYADGRAQQIRCLLSYAARRALSTGVSRKVLLLSLTVPTQIHVMMSCCPVLYWWMIFVRL